MRCFDDVLPPCIDIHHDGLAGSAYCRRRYLGQIDTFEDGTTQNWFAGGGPLGQTPPVPPTSVPSGGPAGLDDNFLLVTAVGGTGPGNRLTVMNGTQWAGNYMASGVNAISMSLNNFGTTDLSLRLLLEDPIQGPPANQALSTNAVVLHAGGGWTSVLFPILHDDLTAFTGTATGALSNATIIRLFHSPTATFPGPSVAALLGVDNIRALNVPEPSTILLVSSGLPALIGRARRRHKQVHYGATERSITTMD